MIRRFRSRFTSVSFILTLGLLLVQLAVPWTVPQIATQDGESHLYTAITTKELLLHPSGSYGSIYTLNPRIVPNWGGTLLLNVSAAIAGVKHAEKMAMTIAILTGFFAISFAIRAFAGAFLWTPIAGFMLQVLFLWLQLLFRDGDLSVPIGLLCCPAPANELIQIGCPKSRSGGALFDTYYSRCYSDHFLSCDCHLDSLCGAVV
jgi:hypothetical protein